MDKYTILKPLIYSRILDLYYHHCHNLTYGPSFAGDHGLFNDFYEELGEQYDRMAEYMIGLFGPDEFETKAINDASSEELSRLQVERMSVEDMFREGLKIEQDFMKALENLDKVASIGVKNLVGELAESIDVRRYKIKQRLR